MRKIVKKFGNSLGISFDGDDKVIHNISEGDILEVGLNNISKKKGEKGKVVYAYVCGDILHRGHLQHLRNAKSMGNYLIVGVLTDEAIMEKKPKPTMTFSERFELISSLKMVDMVVSQETYSPSPNISKLKPDIMVESDSHDEKLINESENTVKKYGGKVIVFPYYMEQSSTNIKNIIKGQK